MRYSDDWAQFVLDLPMSEAPGEKFEYCNGVSYLLSVIIQNATNMKTLDFARAHLFEPLGIHDVKWERSPQGIDAGYGGLWLTPHDMAQFGWLYLNQGHWGNRQIIPSAWIEASTRAHISATLFDDYGYQWWVDSGGYFMAVGHRGQRIFIVPEKNLVAVFTGDLRDSRLALILKNLLDFYIIPAASSSNALPINRQEQARLDTLVNRVAKRKAYSWISEKEGMAEDGVFKRTASPAFKFEYPPGSKKETIRYPNQIMRMRTLGDVLFSAYVLDIPKGMKPEDFGPKFYARDLENYGSNIKVNSNQEITLDCGTKAYQTEITWLWGSKIWMTDFIVSAYRDDQVVCLLTETWKHHDKLEPIVQSLTFK